MRVLDRCPGALQFSWQGVTRIVRVLDPYMPGFRVSNVVAFLLLELGPGTLVLLSFTENVQKASPALPLTPRVRSRAKRRQVSRLAKALSGL